MHPVAEEEHRRTDVNGRPLEEMVEPIEPQLGEEALVRIIGVVLARRRRAAVTAFLEHQMDGGAVGVDAPHVGHRLGHVEEGVVLPLDEECGDADLRHEAGHRRVVEEGGRVRGEESARDGLGVEDTDLGIEAGAGRGRDRGGCRM